ncbi:hypothetical protein [Azospirillum sp.]|uniref:hypothetical protein n=1 Tax=Azospirillum sp. TaxID=34012 RepID=UPI002D2A2CAF|nr:hypothetical protein [Azospirillum sp.]HYD64524.1 hypothetical protein [Azospirillum sp.]
MDAVVLTFDHQAGLAELVHKSYRDLWPGCPLRFRIPVNDRRTNPSLAYLAARPDVVLVDSPPDIRATMAALLDGLDDDAWVYWCIDDRFPEAIPAPAALDALGARLAAGEGGDASAVRLIHWHETLTGPPVELAGQTFRRQRYSGLFGFWHHQFARAGLLRRVFLSPELPGDYDIRTIQALFHDLERERPGLAGALVPVRPLVRLGEPCCRGRLTLNGLDALRRHGCPVPDYAVEAHRRVFEDMAVPVERTADPGEGPCD